MIMTIVTEMVMVTDNQCSLMLFFSQIVSMASIAIGTKITFFVIIVFVASLIIITVFAFLLICFVIGCQVARWFLAVTNYPHYLSVTSTTSQSQLMHNGILLREMEVVIEVAYLEDGNDFQRLIETKSLLGWLDRFHTAKLLIGWIGLV